MCGRNTLTSNIKSITEDFSIDTWEFDNLKAQYNISPSSFTPVLIHKNEKRVVKKMRWGLIPQWASEKSIGSQMINARSETISEKPSFQNLIQQNRCVIFSNGYFEWKTINGKKQPYYITNKRKLFSFAGLWSRWKSINEDVIYSYTIITTKSQKNLSKIYHRMPVILNNNDVDKWINHTKYNFNVARTLLKPYLHNLYYHNVSPFVNSTKNDTIRCIENIENPYTINLF
ncbi:MAG: SOS response-associated peptidase [Candidatus Marinimicrobia bacterium]|jgi:putative SOS response-associated peptidase YedK|nr:SOS response-associated peptidase [Candidatus Neomarinimicrobiota bacterium]